MVNRRVFMAASAVSVSSTSTAASAQGGPASAPAPVLARVRRDVTTPAAAANLAKYRNAVSQLIALPPSDPRQWNNLAQQHQDHCPHSNWWFLPWHRAYLFYFERVCQDILKDPSFALPYWDWTQNPRIPGAFWAGVLAGNGVSPVVSRVIGPNEDIPSEFVGRKVIERFMADPQLVTAYSSAPQTIPGHPMGQRDSGSTGLLEGTPHNNVHNQVDGTMGTFLSPLDPIFWLHHANVDRLWASWSAQHGGAAPIEQKWGSLKLESFWDPVSKKMVSEPTSRTKSLDPYGYSYDRLEKSPAAAAPPASLMVKKLTDLLPPVQLAELANQKTHFVLASALPEMQVNGAQLAALKTTAAFDSVVQSNLKAEGKARPVTLVLEGVEVPAGRRIALRVFLNCKNPSLASPIDDPSYVGTVSPFGQDHQHHAMPGAAKGVSFALDATETLNRLTAIGSYKPGAVDVALVVTSSDPTSAGTVVRPGKVALVSAGT